MRRVGGAALGAEWVGAGRIRAALALAASAANHPPQRERAEEQHPQHRRVEQRVDREAGPEGNSNFARRSSDSKAVGQSFSAPSINPMRCSAMGRAV